MIEKFNNIYYLIIYVIHFAIVGAYAFQTSFRTRQFLPNDKFATLLDDSAFGMIRFVGAFMTGWVIMALYVMFIRNNGVVGAGSFFNLIL